jgi:hypothetical protein
VRVELPALGGKLIDRDGPLAQGRRHRLLWFIV